MRGEFENIWQDAFEGASITPSEEVWNGIASRMDNNSGKRNWVTILLIAATVTVAFAFPLTVGNSEYEFRPQEAEITSTNQAEDLNSGNLATSPDDLAPGKSDRVVVAKEPIDQGQVIDRVEEPAFDNEMTAATLSSTDLGMGASSEKDITYQLLQKEPGSGLNQYYILPAYKRKESNFDRSLMAFGNINSGRQTAGNFSTMDFVGGSADFENGPDLSNRKNSNRSEDGGATFYVGLGAELPVSKRINLTAGIGYQNQRLNGTSNTIYEENGKQFPVGIYDPLLPGTIFLSENYDYISNNQFISVPVGAKFALVNKRVKLRFGLGLSPDFMLSHRVTSSEYGTSKTSLSETAYNTVQFTGLVNLDVLLPIHTNYGLAIETGLRQGLVPYAQNGSEFASSFNFGIILFYQLKNSR